MDEDPVFIQYLTFAKFVYNSEKLRMCIVCHLCSKAVPFLNRDSWALYAYNKQSTTLRNWTPNVMNDYGQKSTLGRCESVPDAHLVGQNSLDETSPMLCNTIHRSLGICAGRQRNHVGIVSMEVFSTVYTQL